MLNLAGHLAAALGEELVHNDDMIYGDTHREYKSVLRTVAQSAIERISNSDALYHHTRYHGWPSHPEG